MNTNTYSNKTEYSNMHLVSKYAHILFEIKCETGITDAFCHEMETILDDSETTFAEIKRLTLTVFAMEYIQVSERLNQNLHKRQPIILNDSIYSSILVNETDLRKYECKIKIRRLELERFILDFENILKN
ncbi:hypothetical protein BK722_12270 [Bacillus thuringiensis serovar finitimus]|nr:hypothetical protein YBT020_28414 [Bacillus thuringiensis serovar finitimus YBT-020]OTX71548.1 hypothetical protein BK722_12270 [Bacillus thuringiensis serovar finitimus]OTY30244.1 hypothetical protein BK736_27205 [Bacillus thuringiensis serovar poloniensis]